MFRVTFPLRFAHCDPAGIAYYPRCLELCDAAIEDWTPAILGDDRRRMHMERGLGLPTVSLTSTFIAPSILGDLLEFAVRLVRVGRSSIELEVEVTCGGAPRFNVRLTQVLIELAGGTSQPWPSEYRQRLEMECQ
ncbi:acyl-CoA thioesterase [Sphingomonas soli]|uniref:acyl-CoA thioesterase n=1 Tax=Sphingomonas soli TaxID=266127 RepID=UPI00082FA2A8|nr:thioesterase family protein [Sphingomonas soli]